MQIMRAFIIWLLIILIEMLHGIARGLFLEPMIGDFRARQIAVFTGSILITMVTFACIRWLKDAATTRLLLVGGMWVILTVAFEIIVGRFAMNLTWDRIFSDYDLRTGGLLPIGLLVMFLAPLVTWKARARLMA